MILRKEKVQNSNKRTFYLNETTLVELNVTLIARHRRGANFDFNSSKISRNHTTIKSYELKYYNIKKSCVCNLGLSISLLVLC